MRGWEVRWGESEMKQGTTRKPEGVEGRGRERRVSATWQVLSFVPGPLSRLWFSFFLFQGERQHLSILFPRHIGSSLVPHIASSSTRPFLSALFMRVLSCASFCLLLLLFVLRHTRTVHFPCFIRENRYCFIMPRVEAICELWLDPSIRSLPHFSLYLIFSLPFFLSCPFASKRDQDDSVIVIWKNSIESTISEI